MKEQPRTDYDVEQIADGVYMIDEFGMALCYLIVGSERTLLIDTGTGLGDLRRIAEALCAEGRGEDNIITTPSPTVPPLHRGELGDGERWTEVSVPTEVGHGNPTLQSCTIHQPPNKNHTSPISHLPSPITSPLFKNAVLEAESDIKYEGYLRKQEREIQEKNRYAEIPLPADFDYLSVGGLRLEARQKLDKVRPSTVGQASRIPGVNPADINVLIIAMKLFERTFRT